MTTFKKITLSMSMVLLLIIAMPPSPVMADTPPEPGPFTQYVMCLEGCNKAYPSWTVWWVSCYLDCGVDAAATILKIFSDAVVCQ